MASRKPGALSKPRPRRPGVFIRMSDRLAQGAREMAASRRVPIHAIFEAAIAAYLSPAAQDRRDAMLARQINRLSRGVETVDFNTKLLVAMQRYLIELELSFLPETSTDEERQAVNEKGARRFDRFEQWLTRQLVDPDNLYHRLQAQFVAQEQDFGEERSQNS
jgi:hypothetical protein